MSAPAPMDTAQLPPKLWERAFRHLTSLQLLRVRLVCRYFRQIIADSSVLRGRHGGVLTDGKMDGSFRPALIAPVGSLQLGGMFIVGASGSWWEGYGPGLTDLTLVDCTATVPALFGLLKHTPNLKELEISDSTVSGYGSPDFRLVKLERLVVDNPNCKELSQDFVDGLHEVFPHLKELRLLRGVTLLETKDRVVASIRALRNTLEKLELCEGTYLDLLCKVDGIRLKHLSCYIDFSSKTWKLFCRKHPSIEKLLVTADSCKMLRKIGNAVPNLKWLPLDISCSMKADFLNDMPNLDQIDFNGHRNALDFGAAANPKLELFHMMYTTATKLIQYLQKSPNLVELNLHECTLLGDSGEPEPFPNLRTLVLSMCKLPPNLILALCLQNPKLERVDLRFLPNLTDEAFAKICQRLPNLRQLAVIQCGQLTDEAGKAIVQHCTALEKLQTHGFAFSDEAIETLRERHVRIKRWFWPYRCDPLGGFAEG